MKLIIDIQEDWEKQIELSDDAFARDFLCYTLHNGIPISDNATNGDVIKTLFSNIKWWANEDNEVFTDHKTINSNRVAINATWWNAPYQKGSKK